ncbi:MAG: hypothetical protein U5Q03_17385 [Bacteroidota bacterium]|nr:hypothetical protein [Bacteroidota bacterium]
MSEQIINNISDYILWYGKDRDAIKIRRLFVEKSLLEGSGARYNQVKLVDGKVRPI